MSMGSTIAGWRLLTRPMARCSLVFRPSPAALHSTLGFARRSGATDLPSSQQTRGICSRPVAAAASTATAEAAQEALPGLGGRPNVVQVLRSRGLIQEVTSPELEAAAAADSLLVYCGFDPTAESLHLGNLLGIIVLAWFQRCGHRPVALLGGATGRVGDPSGKSVERPVLSDEVVENNVRGIERILRTLLSPSAGTDLQEPLVVNNLDWLGNMGLLTFLRDVGKFARVGTMTAKESVKRRMESEDGISYTEFTYQLLQGYDFVHLCREMGVRVQVGGSDQWGNITAGTDLIRRMLGGPSSEQPSAAATASSASAGNDNGSSSSSSSPASGSSTPQCFGLTFPLLLKADGTKFGKSESGAVWLNADMLSPYQFYQFLFKTVDADVVRFMRMLTFMPLEEIEEIERSMQSEGYVANSAQRRLAEEVTRFVHGEEGLQQAIKATQALAPGATTELDAATLEGSDAPSATLSRSQVVGMPLADVMVLCGMQPSKAAVKRMIKGGGVRLNNAKVEDELAVVQEGDLIEGRLLLIAAGKKNKMLVRVD